MIHSSSGSDPKGLMIWERVASLDLLCSPATPKTLGYVAFSRIDRGHYEVSAEGLIISQYEVYDTVSKFNRRLVDMTWWKRKDHHPLSSRSWLNVSSTSGPISRRRPEGLLGRGRPELTRELRIRKVSPSSIVLPIFHGRHQTCLVCSAELLRAANMSW